MYARLLCIVILFILLALVGGCQQQVVPAPTQPIPSPAPIPPSETSNSGPFILTSPSFKHGETIPTRHTRCGGENISPRLSWSGVPPGTKALALIVDDPDPAPILHWVVYGMSGTDAELPEGVQAGPTVVLGVTGRGQTTGWFGPCPPQSRGPHTYVFTLFALSEQVDLASGATADQILTAIEGTVLDTAVLTGTFER